MTVEGHVMERRNFLKLAFGVAAGAAAFAASAQAAPLSPQPIDGAEHLPRSNADVLPALTSGEEAAQLKPEQVHWRRHWGWRHRHWGWRHRHHRHYW
jgi:hypothetical protein